MCILSSLVVNEELKFLMCFRRVFQTVEVLDIHLITVIRFIFVQLIIVLSCVMAFLMFFNIEIVDVIWFIQNYNRRRVIFLWFLWRRSLIQGWFRSLIEIRGCNIVWIILLIGEEKKMVISLWRSCWDAILHFKLGWLLF